MKRKLSFFKKIQKLQKIRKIFFFQTLERLSQQQIHLIYLLFYALSNYIFFIYEKFFNKKYENFIKICIYFYLKDHIFIFFLDM